MLALLFLMFDDDPLKLFKQESPHVCLRVYKKVQIMRCASNSIIQRKRKTQRTEWMVLPMKEKNTGIRKYFGKVRSSYSCCFLAKQTREPTPCPTKPLLHHFPPVVFVWPWGQHVICAHWEELGCMGKMGELNRAGLVWAFIFLSLLAFSFQEQKSWLLAVPLTSLLRELAKDCSFAFIFGTWEPPPAHFSLECFALPAMCMSGSSPPFPFYLDP